MSPAELRRQQEIRSFFKSVAFAQELPPESEWAELRLPALAEAVAMDLVTPIINTAKAGHNATARTLADLAAERIVGIERKLLDPPAEHVETADVDALLARQRGGVEVRGTGHPVGGVESVTVDVRPTG
jgi:hypothetical protein